MGRDIQAKVNNCDRCVGRKALPEQAATCQNQNHLSFRVAGMDYMSLEPDQSNTKDNLVLTDHFTKFAVAIPTANQKCL